MCISYISFLCLVSRWKSVGETPLYLPPSAYCVARFVRTTSHFYYYSLNLLFVCSLQPFHMNSPIKTESFVYNHKSRKHYRSCYPIVYNL